MIDIYKTNTNNKLVQINNYEKNCWINLISPKENEIEEITKLINIDKNYLIWKII